MRAIFSICLVLLTGLVSPGNAQAEGGGAFTVFVTRHAEKADTSRDAELSDTFAANLDCTYTSVAAGGASGNTAAGSGNISDTLTLPAGSSVT